MQKKNQYVTYKLMQNAKTINIDIKEMKQLKALL